MLRVHRSRDATILVDRLAEELTDADVVDPFTPEAVVIQSAGMRRWLSHQLSERLGQTGHRDGICANVRFQYPDRIVHEIIRTSTGEDPDRWRPDRLVWSIVEVLPGIIDETEAGPLRTYLERTDQVDRRNYALCHRIAGQLYRYVIYRPTMITDWRQGRPFDSEGDQLPAAQLWQPLLWNRLVARLGSPSPDEQFTQAVTALRDADMVPLGLPPRIAFFGVNSFPPSYLELISVLATTSQVDIFVTPPSSALWERIRDPERERGGRGHQDRRGSGLDQRNPLLVSCGALARDFQLTLETLPGGYDDLPAPEPRDRNDHGTVLELVQADIDADRERGAPSAVDDPRRPAPVALQDDRSLQVHACHGSARQVEVLRDVLLGLFDGSDLEPRDVLVMTPDIATYAPLVRETFARGPKVRGPDGEPPAIPFQLADRSLRRTNAIAEALLEILYLADSRFEVSRVLDLLSPAAVRQRFGIQETDMRTIRAWLADTGIRWGIDPEHRADRGQPPDRFHTWRFGLDRLLVGVTMADQRERVFADVTPYDDMEGDDVELLSRFTDFAQTLFDAADVLREARPLEEWSQALNEVLDQLTTIDDDDVWLDQQVRDDIAATVDASHTGADGASPTPVTLTGIRTVLEATLDDVPGSAGYETGKVTVCSMIPMRSIPHRVVCLLGMDDGAFPRNVRPEGSDLIASSPQLGDATRRDEDRHLFLEAVLSARDHLIVTYTGRDVKTNEQKAPAVPVGELLDVLDRSLRDDERGPTARERLVTEHPLQAFSPRNFGIDDRGEPREPLSYDLEQLAAARTLLADRQRIPDFFPEQLPATDDDPDVIELHDLVAFYDNPTKWLLNTRLGLRLREYHTHLADVEPVEAGHLESWGIGDSLLDARLQGLDHDTWATAYLSRGAVPVGAPGEYEIEKVAEPVDVMTGLVLEVRVPDPEDLPVDVAIDEHRLLGNIPEVHDDVILRWQYTRIKHKHRLQQWVRLLALTAAYPETAIRSRLVAKAPRGNDVEDHRIEPLSADPDEAAEIARAHLALLIQRYVEGHRAPLPLFPEASPAYATAIREGASPTDALAAAKEAWEANGHSYRGDVNDEHIAHVYGDLEFATVVDRTDFADVALEAWLPLLEAQDPQ